ncbi:Rne/Rng family ribonuclease [Candidatus Dependentiae bacterium]|nr:Rne/Rng family ribonuclease [Candidatus Dependentiae bacterium]
MKKILINQNPWESRVSIVRNGTLENIFFGQSTDKVIERSFFKGSVAKVLPGIQTAFVDIGQERAGFLHVSEIDRDLALNRIMGPDQIELDDDIRPKVSPEKIDISKILKDGEDLLVQVSKEPVDEKGAKLTTCFTFPGRFVVLTPNIAKIGVSKKIEDKLERVRLKEIVAKHIPSGMGAVIRTSAETRTEEEIYKDLSFLIADWNKILSLYEKATSKSKIYEDVDISLQVIRDHLDNDVEAIVTDNAINYDLIYKYVNKVAPDYKFKVKKYHGKQPLFDRYEIDQQIQKALEPKVQLPSGGSIVIDTTEALTVIDVNTGKFIGKGDMEETVLKTNVEAAKEIVLQLKLRNIGGLIVIDFIDMSNQKNRQKLVVYFEKALKEFDRFQSVVLQVSEFGIVQMTRKRSGKTLMRQLMDDCHHCKGLGQLMSTRAECYQVLRDIKRVLSQHKDKNILLSLNEMSFHFITSIEFNSILALEAEFNCHIVLSIDETLKKNEFRLKNK